AVDRFWHAFSDNVRGEDALHKARDGKAAAAHYRKAANGFVKVLEDRPGRVWTHVSWANCLSILGDKFGAVAGFTNAIHLRPDIGWLYANRGVVHMHLGELEAARADFDKAIELDPEDPNNFSNRAVFLMNTNQPQLALADLDAAISLTPRDPSLYARRGILNSNLQNLPQAIADFSEALQLKPGDPDSLRNRAIARLLTKDLDASLLDWQEFGKVLPNHHESYYYTGAIELGRAHFAEAIVQLTRALEKKPNDSQALLARATAYRWSGDLAAAKADLDLVLDKIEANDPKADNLIERADLLRATGQHAAAVDAYLRCVTLAPKQIDGYIGLAHVYEALEKPILARESYDRMVKADTAAPTPRLRHAAFLRDQREFSEALAECDRAAQKDPKSVLPGLLRASIAAAQGHSDTALQQAEELLSQAAPRDGKVLLAALEVYSLALRAYQQQSNPPAAPQAVAQCQQRAIELLTEIEGPCFHELVYPEHNRLAWNPALAAIRDLPQVQELLKGRK
ncbi:MAG: tetratricopeptide repeat protein, partial [Planctomycetes bacterium]|nr:tetratricopeptide repeat protein [Planctomycetota bacterium]